jgi:hypothetical protein
MAEIYHFNAQKVVYKDGILKKLVYNCRTLNAKLLGEIQEYKNNNNLDFEVFELNRNRLIKYKI